MRLNISSNVDGGTKGPVKRAQMGSEDPHLHMIFKNGTLRNLKHCLLLFSQIWHRRVFIPPGMAERYLKWKRVIFWTGKILDLIYKKKTKKKLFCDPYFTTKV